METQKGIVVHICTKQGYGFIQLKDSNEQIFFHAVGCIDPEFEDLREGMEVEYLVTTSHRTGKPRAIGVVES